MSLLVQCHQCSKVLELDDGFRGGVCRCRQCGALLRVPMTDTHQVQKSRPAEPAASKVKLISEVANAPQDGTPSDGRSSTVRPESPVTSSSRQLRPESPNVLAGSGAMRPARPESPLAESLSKPSHQPTAGAAGVSREMQRPSAPSQPHTPSQHKDASDAARAADSRYRKWANLPIGMYAALAAGVLFVAIIIILWVIRMLAGGAPSSSVGTTGQAQFLGIPIQAKSVVFSLDGSSANADSFNMLVALVSRTLQKLPASTSVKIAVWRPTGLKVYPARGWLTPISTKAAMHSLSVYSPYGSTSITKMMVRTLKLGAVQNIITTQKIIVPGELPAAIAAAAGPQQQIDIVSVNGEERILKKIAKSTGGQFKIISPTHLQSLLSE